MVCVRHYDAADRLDVRYEDATCIQSVEYGSDLDVLYDETRAIGVVLHRVSKVPWTRVLLTKRYMSAALWAAVCEWFLRKP